MSLPSLKVHRVTLRQVQKQENAGVNASLQTKIVYLQIINILSWNLLLVLIPLLHIPTAQISLIPSWIPTSADASVLSQPMTVLRMQNSIQTNVVAKRRLLALVIKTMIVGAMHSIITLRQMTLLLCWKVLNTMPRGAYQVIKPSIALAQPWKLKHQIAMLHHLTMYHKPAPASVHSVWPQIIQGKGNVQPTLGIPPTNRLIITS